MPLVESFRSLQHVACIEATSEAETLSTSHHHGCARFARQTCVFTCEIRKLIGELDSGANFTLQYSRYIKDHSQATSFSARTRGQEFALQAKKM